MQHVDANKIFTPENDIGLFIPIVFNGLVHFLVLKYKKGVLITGHMWERRKHIEVLLLAKSAELCVWQQRYSVRTLLLYILCRSVQICKAVYDISLSCKVELIIFLDQTICLLHNSIILDNIQNYMYLFNRFSIVFVMFVKTAIINMSFTVLENIQ